MPPLHEDLFGQLENTVTRARTHAETGARAALQRWAVDAREPFDHLGPAQRQLRNELRARGRQLGDRRAEDGSQTLDRLAAECAYEFWHRMLFARFLAENDLLIHPQERVPLSLQDCAELAEAEGIDGWTYAARCAAHMLPEIFRPDNPLLQVPFAPEHLQELEHDLDGLPAEVFTADDSLGWVYQFWQAKRNDEVNKSGKRIGGSDLPAVTQFFTEPYMVQFLLHNTLGAWWVSRHPGQTAPVSLDYLRLREDGTPAAGTFPGWPATAKELKILDPCCGSGHFLVAAFGLLMRFRMHDERLSAREACAAVLRDNLFGLELDPRCTQVAAFNLALTAWKFQQAEGTFDPRRLHLPQMHIACSGQAPKGKRDDWLRLAAGNKRLRWGMELLWDLFRQAEDLGSLIDPREVKGSAMVAGFEELEALVQEALKREDVRADTDLAATGIAAQGIAKAAELMAGRYHLVLTNVPFLTRGKQDEILRKFLHQEYRDSRTDLATAFLERCLRYSSAGGTIALVTPQNWHFLGSYKALRKRLLTEASWNAVVKLGPAAFRHMNWWAANNQLCILTNALPDDEQVFAGWDVSRTRSPAEKAEWLQSQAPLMTNQAGQLLNPDYRIAFEAATKGNLLSAYAYSHHGLTTGDIPRMTRFFWEIDQPDANWIRFASSVDETCDYGGRRELFCWCNGGGAIDEIPGARKDGQGAWGQQGVLVRQMRHLPVTLYTGDAFDSNNAAVIPHDPAHLPAIWAFCRSPEFHREVRRIDQQVKVTNATLVKVPFNLERWQAEAEKLGPLPRPHSNDPTQWLFKGDVVHADAPDNLQVAVARLLGYRWPDQPADKLDRFADPEGIACLPGILGNASAAERLRDLLIAAYGSDWSSARQEVLLAAVDFGGKGLHEWLRDGFFAQHCDCFHNRPFVWHVWDGRKDGFSAIVNYHQLDRRRLEILTYTYLGEWIRRQTKEQEDGASGADGRLADSLKLQNKLKLILEGEEPYDIFVRWKPLAEQPIGWEPDLNDGVRLNIRPFVKAEVLRKKPGIHWKKDKGRDPKSAPWYDVFHGDRINDHHLCLAGKRATR